MLAVGDQAFQEKCFETFERFREEGKTVVFVSHDLATVQRFCERAVLLEQGQMAAIGSSEDVVERYVHGAAQGVAVEL